jgi:hypothetical protein
MKIIKLFVIHILLLSSFQTFAEELRITTADVSTPSFTLTSCSAFLLR